MMRFDPTVFSLSPSFSFETVATPYAPVSIIRDFYGDLGSVRKEINKLPGSPTAGEYTKFQGKDYWDLRKSYAPSMEGTHLPLLQQLPKQLGPILDVDAERVRVFPQLLVNAFKKKDSFPKERVFFGAHTDPYYMGMSQVALVVFLNMRYNKGEGLNFYSSLRKDPGNEGPYTSEHETPPCWFVQAQSNMAVLFDSAYPHGQAVGGHQFLREWRQTQVIFAGVTGTSPT